MSQYKLLVLAKAFFVPEKDYEGFCYGFANMAMQAILTNNYPAFDERMKFINQSSAKDLRKLPEQIDAILGFVANKSLSLKRELLLNQNDRFASEDFDSYFDRQSSAKKKELLKIIDDQLAEYRQFQTFNEKNFDFYINLRAALEGMLTHQKIKDLPQLFDVDVNSIPFSNYWDFSYPLTKSKTIDEDDIRIEKLFKTSLFYSTPQDLDNFFKSMDNKFQNEEHRTPVSISIDDGLHAINIISPKKGYWYSVDANGDQIELTSTSSLSSFIRDALIHDASERIFLPKDQGSNTITLTFYSSNFDLNNQIKDEQAFLNTKLILEKFKETPEWALTVPTPDRVQLENAQYANIFKKIGKNESQKTPWIIQAAQAGDTKKMASLIDNGVNLDYDWITRLDDTVKKGEKKRFNVLEYVTITAKYSNDQVLQESLRKYTEKKLASSKQINYPSNFDDEEKPVQIGQIKYSTNFDSDDEREPVKEKVIPYQLSNFDSDDENDSQFENKTLDNSYIAELHESKEKFENKLNLFIQDVSPEENILVNYFKTSMLEKWQNAYSAKNAGLFAYKIWNDQLNNLKNEIMDRRINLANSPKEDENDKLTLNSDKPAQIHAESKITNDERTQLDNLEKELQKEEKNFPKGNTVQSFTEKNKKYIALQKLYNYIRDNKSNPSFYTPEFIDLYQQALKFTSHRFQQSFFAHKSDNLQQLLKNIPERVRKDILTPDVVNKLPDKYKKTIPMNLPTFEQKKPFQT